MSGVLLGLLAALSWGFADYLAQPASRQLGAMWASFFAQLVGLLVLLVYLLLSGQALFPGDMAAWAWALGSAVLGTAGSLAFYQSVNLGKLAVVAPIMGSYGAVTTVLAWLSGQHLSLTVVLGLLSALLAVVLVSLPRQAGDLTLTPAQVRGVWWGVFAALSLGACFYVMGLGVSPRLGGVHASWAMRMCSLILTFLSLRVLRIRLVPLRAGMLVSPATSGVLSMLAIVFTALGLGRGEDSIVTVLGSMSVVITTLLALLVNRERLTGEQWLGVGLALLGTLLIGQR